MSEESFDSCRSILQTALEVTCARRACFTAAGPRDQRYILDDRIAILMPPFFFGRLKALFYPRFGRKIHLAPSEPKEKFFV
jgi:hypothetical protein